MSHAKEPQEPRRCAKRSVPECQLRPELTAGDSSCEESFQLCAKKKVTKSYSFHILGKAKRNDKLFNHTGSFDVSEQAKFNRRLNEAMTRVSPEPSPAASPTFSKCSYNSADTSSTAKSTIFEKSPVEEERCRDSNNVTSSSEGEDDNDFIVKKVREMFARLLVNYFYEIYCLKQTPPGWY